MNDLKSHLNKITEMQYFISACLIEGIEFETYTPDDLRLLIVFLNGLKMSLNKAVAEHMAFDYLLIKQLEARR